jgi:formate C-acetyltransferase
MYPYFKKDMDNGIYTEETALELIEEFFLTFNRDSDMYPGMQQGDNGQSMVLGGMDEEGHDQFNSLSELCLKAAYDLHVIDPKINVRVHRHTPLSTYILGTNLTKKGLGFPQYSSDDIIIPGLIKLGYSKEDAYNYVVAACWEFIVPGKGMDIPNIGALSFAGAVADATTAHLLECETYQDFQDAIDANIRGACNDLMDSTKNVFLFPAPFLSLMMDGCVEKGKDVSLGCIYNNYGFHGTGLATAADSLINIRKYIYEQKTMTKEALLMTLNDDFKNENRICNIFRYESEKMGNNDDEVDAIAAHLLDTFSNALKGHRNDRGGIFRAGTGSAMYYIWHSKDLMATADGRHKGEGIPANYSPSLFCKNIGPVSIIKSFTKSDLSKCVNGGPLTLELHDTMFRNSESIEKVATFVKSFFDLGGHQLQLNAVDRDTLLDAQKHPEKYRNLIVRVWGWSGYFVELDKCYQDHIIQRIELST